MALTDVATDAGVATALTAAAATHMVPAPAARTRPRLLVQLLLIALLAAATVSFLHWLTRARILDQHSEAQGDMTR